MTWRLKAACRLAIERGEAEPNWWFPERFDKTGSKARAICATCPVILECELAAGGQTGIWAGKSSDERRGSNGNVPTCHLCGVPVEPRCRYCPNCRQVARRESQNRWQNGRRKWENPPKGVSPVLQSVEDASAVHTKVTS